MKKTKPVKWWTKSDGNAVWKMRQDGLALQEIADKMGISNQRVRSKLSTLKRCRPPIESKYAQWTSELADAAWEMNQSGITLQGIADKLGFTKQQVSSKLSVLRRGREPATKKSTAPKSIKGRVAIPCMCCKREFGSWDRKRNRLCTDCKAGVRGSEPDNTHTLMMPRR